MWEKDAIDTQHGITAGIWGGDTQPARHEERGERGQLSSKEAQRPQCRSWRKVHGERGAQARHLEDAAQSTESFQWLELADKHSMGMKQQRITNSIINAWLQTIAGSLNT